MAVQLILIFFGTALISAFSTRIVLGFLRKKAILDHPNERSSHSIPTPRGGGIGILLTVIPALLFINGGSEIPLSGFWTMMISVCILATLSWLDDIYTLGSGIRFALQILCVSLCMYSLQSPENGFSQGFLPLWIEKTIIAIGWVWFINLFNFMDGINGISGVEIISISLGITIISLLETLRPEYIYSSIVLAAAAFGFLKWNWNKAKIFMGDVGSIPLGFILGWLLINLAAEGFLIAALILPLYYLLDATITLTRRALRKEKVWQAHREHFYQQATQKGMSHKTTALCIAGLNVILIACAIMSFLYSPLLASIIAITCSLILMYLFASRIKGNNKT